MSRIRRRWLSSRFVVVLLLLCTNVITFMIVMWLLRECRLILQLVHRAATAQSVICAVALGFAEFSVFHCKPQYIFCNFPHTSVY